VRTRLLCAAMVALLIARPAEPSGVVAVAGPIGFNPNVVGQPIKWANASLTYYTDLGDLSPVLPQDAANAFVADAFARWTSAPSTALAVTRGGALAQDVSGANVFVSGGQLTMPSDVLPSASHRPLGVIYDSDGQVVDALLGAGAGAATFCETNAVVGGADAYTAEAHFAHALLVLNGNCAQQSSDLATMKYRLVRMAGRILGVGWTLLNDNVRTGSPPPTSEELAGFPVMHPRGPNCQGPITGCLANADQLRMDDRAAIAALYPAAGPTGTARIRGSIYFSDERGQAGQPMQGVNVVARRLDPVSGTPSKVFASASVSGFRFRGAHGNPVTGFLAAGGEPLARFGSGDIALQGFYDLPGLEIPAGQSSASYQLTLEPLNPLYKNEFAVGPARYGVVTPSGSVAPVVVVNLTAGVEVTRDIVVANSARVRRDAAEPNTFSAPAPIPAGGTWWATLSPHGDSDFHHFRVRAGRSFHLRVTALDEAHVSTALKAQPTIGLWVQGAPAESAPSLFVAPFNTAVQGQTKLSVSVNADADLILGIADMRGDGRPDYRYHARLLYAEAATPARLPANTGGLLLLNGYGFNGNTTVSIGGQHAPVLVRGGSRLLVQAPALGNGAANVVVTDLATGDAATITGGLRYGVISGDLLQVLSSGNPAVPVGSETPNPIRMRVTTADGVTPVAGVAVTFSASPIQSFFPACGSNPCTVVTDAPGEVIVRLAVRADGENTITASLANGAQVQATIVGSMPTLAIHASRPTLRVPQGATLSLPVSVRVLANGSPVVGQAVNFSFGTSPSSGAALAAPSVSTNAQGDAVNQVNLSALGSGFTLLVCVAGGSPCTTLNINTVPVASRQLQVVQGGAQLLTSGQTAAPIVLRITDGTDATRPIRGAAVTAATSVFARLRDSDCDLQNSDCHPASARPMATSFTTLVSDENGLVAFTPAIQTALGAVNVYTLFSVGAGTGQSAQASIQVFK